jgi:cardiolipin synthase
MNPASRPVLAWLPLVLFALLACSVEPLDSRRPGGVAGQAGSAALGGSAGKTDDPGGASGGNGGAAGAAGSAGAAGAAGQPQTGGAGGVAEACSELDPRNVPAEVAVLPDAGEAPFVTALASAQSSIDVMVYQMGYGGVLDTLTSKAKAGVAVRVILDVAQKSVNQKYMDALIAAGAEVQWSDPGFTYMHAKVILVDGTVAVISTGNYLKSYMLKERNFVVTDRDPWDLSNLVSLFEADWLRMSPMLDCTRLLVSPINAKSRILSLIEGAQSTLVIESMQLADSSVRNAVAARKAAGVDVRVLLASPSWIDSNQSAAEFLASNGIPARFLSSPSVHVKAIVADGARAYTGSENLSYTSLTKNREVGVVMTEAPAVAAIASTFDKDWANATPF